MNTLCGPDLKFMILLLLSSKFWDYRHVSQGPATVPQKDSWMVGENQKAFFKHMLRTWPISNTIGCSSVWGNREVMAASWILIQHAAKPKWSIPLDLIYFSWLVVMTQFVLLCFYLSTPFLNSFQHFLYSSFIFVKPPKWLWNTSIWYHHDQKTGGQRNSKILGYSTYLCLCYIPYILVDFGVVLSRCPGAD